MKREDVLIAALAGTSVVLVVLIVLTASGRGPLMAQSVDRSSGFVLVTGRFDQDRDALYMLDERSGQMAVFAFSRNRNDIDFAEVRDLRADFSIKLKRGTDPGVREHKPR